MKKIIKQFLFLLTIIAILILPYFVFAVEKPLDNLRTVGETASYKAGATSDSVLDTISMVINVFFSILGIIFIVITLIAGYNYMTAQGDKDKVSKAIDSIKTAIIGLIITVGSFAIWNFIFNNFIK